MATNKISILLIKSQYENINDIIKEGCSNEQLSVGMFYYKRSSVHSPLWADKFFDGCLNCESLLKSSSVQGVLIVHRIYEREQRFFAICFGFGRNLIKVETIEERFGLITTLNTVDEKSLRSIDINSLEAIPKNDRIQSSALSDIPNFNIDIERDLLRAVTGRCSIEALGKSISGADTLCLSTDVNIDNIVDILDVSYKRYKLNKYKEHFAWIDQISRIKSNEVLDKLNRELLQKLNSKDLDKIWMSIPEIVDWENIYELKLGRGYVANDDIDINTVLSEVFNNKVDSIEDLKIKHVEVVNCDNIVIHKWQYFKCLYAEIELANEQYILNNGLWYYINTDFVRSINEYYDNASINSLHMINFKYKSESEGEYNIEAAKSSSDFLCMDKKLIPTGVVGNDIEFCDIYTKNKQMIHIKKYGGSSVLSHLFNQGLVSARLLFEKTFRQNLNVKLKDGWKVPIDDNITTSNYEVVFGIISKYDEEPPHIPFFSKITFKNVASTLQRFGYKVSLMRIFDENKDDK